MSGWLCRGCRRLLAAPSPRYCSEDCLAAAAGRRRAAAATRARARRDSVARAANTRIETTGDFIVTRTWRHGHIDSERWDPIA